MLRHWNMYTSALWHGGKVETLLFTCEPATVEPVGRVKNYRGLNFQVQVQNKHTEELKCYQICQFRLALPKLGHLRLFR